MVNIVEVKSVRSGQFGTVVNILCSIVETIKFTFTPKDPIDYAKYEDSDTSLSEYSSESDSDNEKDVLENLFSEEKKKEKIPEGGLKISSLASKKHILLHGKFKASEFTSYKCLTPELEVKLNVETMSKFFKCMSNGDTITFAIEGDLNKYGIADEETIDNELKIIFENSSKQQTTCFHMSLQKFNDDEQKMPSKINYKYNVKMPLNDLYSHCKNLSSFSDNVEIIVVKDKLELKTNGSEHGTVKIEILKNSSGLNIFSIDTKNEFVGGTFELKNLVNFTKCTSLCNTASLFIDNSKALVVEYEIPYLGELKMCLTRKVDKDE